MNSGTLRPYLNGGFGEVESWKVEVRQNELRRAELQATIAAASSQPSPPALHPSMATVFEQKVRQLAAALAHDDIELRESARSTLRGFIDKIIIPPGDGLLRVVGRLGEMLTAAGARSDSAAVGNGGCGGSPKTTSASLLDGSVNVRFSLLFREICHVRRTLGRRPARSRW